MIALALALLLSQTPSTPPELLQYFEKERGPMIESLKTKYACARPAKNPKALCSVALVDEKGTAPDLSGQNTFMGVTWVLKRGKAGKAEVGTPRLSALALNKDSAGVWGAVTDITPQDAAEQKMLARLTKDYEALLEGRKATVPMPENIGGLLSAWSKTANHLVEKKGDSWVFKGASGGLRKVGEHWVLMGSAKTMEGIVVSVFVPYGATK